MAALAGRADARLAAITTAQETMRKDFVMIEQASTRIRGSG
jgi:hypothetical protein